VDFSAQVKFPASAVTVAEMFATEAYVMEKITASGAAPGTVEIVVGPGGAVTIATRRELPATEIPASYRSLVGSSLEIHEVDAWEAPETDGGRRGTMAIEITGAPVRVTGTLELRPAPDGTSSLRLMGEIKASIPFFGKAVEKALAENVDRTVEIERQVGLDWLARH
jgi:hypothetical protein